MLSFVASATASAYVSTATEPFPEPTATHDSSLLISSLLTNIYDFCSSRTETIIPLYAAEAPLTTNVSAANNSTRLCTTVLSSRGCAPVGCNADANAILPLNNFAIFLF